MRWPLRYQILLPFAGVMLAVVVAVSVLDAWLSAGAPSDRSNINCKTWPKRWPSRAFH